MQKKTNMVSTIFLIFLWELKQNAIYLEKYTYDRDLNQHVLF